MGLKSSSCHPESSLRRSAISRTWAYKGQEDLNGLMQSTQMSSFVVGVPLTLNGVFDGQMQHAGQISFFVTDAALQDLQCHLEIKGYDPDGNMQVDVVKLGPITEATLQIFQSNLSFTWIESITPIFLSDIAAAVDLLEIGTRYANGQANPGHGMALPCAAVNTDEISVFVMIPGGTGVTEVTLGSSGPNSIDFDHQLFIVPAAAQGRWFLFVYNPGRE